ncbi:SHOCT domain-containing protein [Paenibacillus glacialis]|uniref:SHOCT domain-containing protein n=1 Tax=Paenibacillus glacialis TaxID=494026 RepID=A0A168F7E5_9BACL|nr:SHOCT domain-containing protein [Paenibacillus glacialis]OAB35935.1 hypothetical protein PGLA_21140 [Paenibacillus glacialis]
MSYVIAIIIGLTVGILFNIRMKKKRQAALNKSSNQLQAMKNQLTNTPTQEFMSADNKCLLSLDETAGKINFTTEESNKTYDMTDILGIQPISHGSTSQDTTTRENVFGNLSSTTRTSRKVSRLELKITVKDMVTPHHSIFFYHGPFAVNEGHPYLEKAETKMNHWIGILNVMMSRGNGIDEVSANIHNIMESAKAQVTQLQPQNSVADELVKISNLLQQGMITQDEYNSLKAKLIS